MSVAFAETSHAASHIELLNKMIDEQQASVECLIVAHNDATMIRRLTDAFENQEVAVLPVCQGEWDACLSQIVAWAVDRGIDHVVIAGHSGSLDSTSPALIGKGRMSTENDKTESNTLDRVLDGAKRTQRQFAECKAHFAEQLSQLCHREELQGLKVSDDFQLNAMFYLANGGVFLRYSLRDGSFCPIE